MIFRVVTGEGIKIDEEVSMVTLPTAGGRIQILPGHSPLVAVLTEGKIKYDRSEYRIMNGVVKVENDKVIVFEELSTGLWLD